MRAALTLVLAFGLTLSGRIAVGSAEDSLKAATRAGLASRVATASAVHGVGVKVAKAWASAIIVGWIAQGLAPPAPASASLVSQTTGSLSDNLRRSPLQPRPPPVR